MANYRRLISYIYAYEGGIKGKNRGLCQDRKPERSVPYPGQRAQCVCREPGYRRLSDVHRRRKAFRQDVYPRRCRRVPLYGPNGQWYV